MKSILITGAAGFIGFHLALSLKKRGDFVVGVDNFNSYYDPRLKYQRNQILNSYQIPLFSENITHTEQIRTIIENHQITHVVHLAAQAGVRHSLVAPLEYVESNLKGFVSILEACKHFPSIKLIYASSSSVYGCNRKMPFSESDETDQPNNLYGATKKANEVMAFAYHQLYQFSITGLRFFTVYGPWGRPDMAYFRFAELISSQRPIPVFNQGEMKRDFTYIDDIIQGVIAAIDLEAKCEIFNLGGNQPIDLFYLIQCLEKSLKQKARMEMLPMQKGDVFQTYADITKGQKWLQFKPKIPLEEGIDQFIEWFKFWKSLRAKGIDSIKSEAIIE